MPICNQGHASTDDDYCSECGTRIGGAGAAPSLIPAAPAASGSGEVCPDCCMERKPAAQFCEVCGYDFAKGASHAPVEAAVAAPAAATAAAHAPAPTPTPVAAIVTTATPLRAPLCVEIVVDPSLAAGSAIAAQCPSGAPARVFPLDLDDNLVGRRSDTKGVYPEIPLDDPGVSRRHLKLLRQPGGGYAALELGSTNGSSLNGAPLEPGVLTPVSVGDEISVGTWTKLRIATKQ